MHMQWAVAQKKKKPTSKHRITHIHPDGHQPTNNHATEPNIQYTVAANNHQPIALPRNRIQHPKKPVNTHPTIRRCSKMLHALTNAVNSKNEPKHDTQYGCINNFPPTTNTTPQTYTTKNNHSDIHMLRMVAHIVPPKYRNRGLSSDRRTTMRTMVLAGSKISIELGPKITPPTTLTIITTHIHPKNTPL